MKRCDFWTRISGRATGERRSSALLCIGAAIAATIAASPAHAVLSFGSPAALNTNAATDSGHDFNTNVVTDGAGNWVAIWTSEDTLGGTIGTDRDILFSRSTNNGATWTAPAALNTDAAADPGSSDYAGTLLTDSAGVWIAAWRKDGAILAARSTNNGATWSAPTTVDSAADNFYPSLATDGSGNWVMAWDGNDGSDADVFFSRSTNGGVTWSAGAALQSNAATDSGNDQGVHVNTDGSGVWIAVWHSNDTLGGTIGSDSDILTARSTNNGATWTSVAAFNTNAATDSGGDFSPKLETDGAGSWVAVWSSSDTLGGTIGSDDDILVSRSSNNGLSWSAPAALNTNAASDSGGDTAPKIRKNSSGDWFVLWISTDTLGGTIGTDDDVLGAVSFNNGAAWTAPEVVNGNASTDSGVDNDAATPAVDASGNWVVVWQTNDTLGGTIGSDFDVLFTTSTSVPVELSEFTVE